MQTFSSPPPKKKKILGFFEVRSTYHCGTPRPKCTIDTYIHVPILLHFQDMSYPVYPLIHRMPFYSISQNFVNIHIVLEKNHELSTYTIVKNRIGI